MVDEQVDDVRTAFLDLVNHGDRITGFGDGPGRAACGREFEAEVIVEFREFGDEFLVAVVDREEDRAAVRESGA